MSARAQSSPRSLMTRLCLRSDLEVLAQLSVPGSGNFSGREATPANLPQWLCRLFRQDEGDYDVSNQVALQCPTVFFGAYAAVAPSLRHSKTPPGSNTVHKALSRIFCGTLQLPCRKLQAHFAVPCFASRLCRAVPEDSTKALRQGACRTLPERMSLMLTDSNSGRPCLHWLRLTLQHGSLTYNTTS